MPGKIPEQRQTEIRNAWLATTIQAQMLEAVAATLEKDPAAALSRIEPSTLKLLKDAQDRGLGTAKASVDVTNSDGSLTPEARQSVLLEILAKRHEA